MEFSVGDKVLVIDENYKGQIVRVSSNEIVIESEDGFELAFTPKELLKIEIEQADLIKKSFAPIYKDEVKRSKKSSLTRSVKSKKDRFPPMEVDLHIEKLVKNFKALDNYDMLTIQLDTAQHKLDFAIKNRIPKIVFIHGVGEGVLKEELYFLFKRYNNLRYYDASYQKYGMGATEVSINLKQG